MVATSDPLLPEEARVRFYQELQQECSDATARAYHHDVGRYLDWCRATWRAFEHARSQDILAYLAALAADHASPSTRHRAYAALSRFYAFLEVQKVIRVNPIEERPTDIETVLPLRKQLVPSLTHAPIESVLRMVSTSSRDNDKAVWLMLDLALLTGARVGSLLRLKLGDFVRDATNATIIVGKEDYPLDAATRTSLLAYLPVREEWAQARDLKTLMLSSSGGQASRQSVWSWLRDACERTGVEPFTLDDVHLLVVTERYGPPWKRSGRHRRGR